MYQRCQKCICTINGTASGIKFKLSGDDEENIELNP